MFYIKRKLMILVSLLLMIGVGPLVSGGSRVSAARMSSRASNQVQQGGLNSLEKKLYQSFYQYYYVKDVNAHAKRHLNRSMRGAKKYHHQLEQKYRHLFKSRQIPKLRILKSSQTSQVSSRPNNVHSVAHDSNAKWFKDGLSHSELNAREWITERESSDEWNAVNLHSGCVGYFQLKPNYLGYNHGGLVNLNHRHQVQVADDYVTNRYGSWVAARKFWENNSWY